MEAKELRIGNYYIDIDNGITEMSGHELYQMAVGENLGVISVNEYNPIPLTGDWLIKLGFKLLEYRVNEIYSHPTFNMHFYIYKNGRIRLSMVKGVFDEKVMKRLKHVHQLQNLYHALTGEELTIK